jgi:ATP-binding cassette subfamily G (WHITE) protein 2 (SNQ2)
MPRTAAEFADYFKKSKLGEANRADMESYELEFVNKPNLALEYMESAQAEHARGFKKARWEIYFSHNFFCKLMPV